MTNCPECGEKVADLDIFCSYCGISLTPSAAVPAEEDPSMSATIVGAPADLVPVQTSEPEPPELPSTIDAEPSDAPIPPPIPSPFASSGMSDPFASTPESPADEEPATISAEPVPAESMTEAQSDSVPESEFDSPAVDEPPIVDESTDAAFDESEPAIPVSETESAPADNEPEEPETSPEMGVADEPLAEAPTPKVILDMAATDSVAPESEVTDSVDESPEFSMTDESVPEEISEPVADSAPEESSPVAEIEEPAPVAAIVSEPAAIDESSADLIADEEISADTEAEPEIREEIADETPAAFVSDEVAAETSEPAPDLSESLPESADQDSISTLEAPAPEFDEIPVAAAIAEPAPADEVPPSTKPNIGNDTDGRKAAKLKPLDEGTLLNNRYEIVRKIGGGGMGAVYLATDRNLGGILRAVKEMVQSYIEHEQQEKAIADFKREAMILTNLEHPSIPTIYDYFYDDKEGRFYLVMKYISGGDLAARLRANPEGRLDEKTVTEWAIQVADVLEYLHRQDPVIVYRDLKPANVMIDGNTNRLMLIDFGIARSINKEEKGVTAVGTMGYAPPELFSGNVEARSDIYSLGSTMFHLLTGADPQSNPLLIFDFQKNPRPRQINPQLSDQIEQILMRSVEYNAELRFRSALELKRALEDHLVNLQQGKVSFGVKAAPSAVGFSEQLVFCGFCGKQIIASDVFCAFCGSQQPIAQQSFHQIPVKAAPASVTAKLYVVLTNDLESAGFTLEKDENLIGRRDPMSNIFPEVDLSKYDPQTKISRRHARIRREGGSFLLEDLGSSNGTILTTGGDTARLLPHQPRLLTNGDRFRVGDTTLQFSMAQ